MAETITLEWQECWQAGTVGVMRRIAGMKNARRDKFAHRDRWENEVEGACAELAVARSFGKYWHSFAGDLSALPGDAGPIQVRWVKDPEGCLPVRPSDPDDARFYMVTGAMPTFTIIGYIHGRDARRREWYREAPPPYWAVPQSALLPHVPDDLF